jgi:outer membrane immunogenic protein
MKLRNVSLVVCMLLIVAAFAAAQDFPKVEAALGYSMVRVSSTGFIEKYTTQGGSSNIALNFSKHVGLVADFGGYNNNNIRGVNVDNTTFTYLFGPRFSHRTDKVTLFGDALFGGAHISASGNIVENGVTTKIAESNNSFSMVIGGGFDFNVSKHMAIRPAQFDYLMTRFNPFNSSPTQNNLRYSAMVVFKF